MTLCFLHSYHYWHSSTSGPPKEKTDLKEELWFGFIMGRKSSTAENTAWNVNRYMPQASKKNGPYFEPNMLANHTLTCNLKCYWNLFGFLLPLLLYLIYDFDRKKKRTSEFIPRALHPARYFIPTLWTHSILAISQHFATYMLPSLMPLFFFPFRFLTLSIFALFFLSSLFLSRNTETKGISTCIQNTQ